MSSNDGAAEFGSGSALSKRHKSKKKLGLFSFKSKKTVTSSGETITNRHHHIEESKNEQVITQVTEEIRQYHQEGSATETHLHVERQAVHERKVTGSLIEGAGSGQTSTVTNLRSNTVIERNYTESHSPSDTASIRSISPVKSKRLHHLRNATFSHFSQKKQKMVDYQGATHKIKVRLLSGQDLAVRDKNGLSDPYVKFKLRGQTLHRSRICYSNLNPKWDNEEFVVSVNKNDEIIVKVYDKDFASRDDFMGMSSIIINELEEKEEVELSLNLEDRDDPTSDEDLGRIHVAVLLTSLYESAETTEHDGPSPSDESIETLSVASLKLQEHHVSRSDSVGSDFGHQKVAEMRHRKMKVPLGSVHIQLISGKDLPARDSNGLSDPYVKFQMGKQKHKSQVCVKTLNPVWKEEFTFILTNQDSTSKDNAAIEITVWDKDSYRKDDFMGRCELALGTLHYDSTSECLLNLADGSGSIKLLVTLQSNRPISYEPTATPTELMERYALPTTFAKLSDVGFVEVKILRANGCRAADMNGKSDPFCIIQLCNARAQTHTCYKTLDPVWNKTVTFPVKDIHDLLVFTVMDEDRDGECDFLGKVTVPLLRAVNGVEKTYALKNKKLLGGVKGTLTVQIRLIYNKARAAIRTFNPREENYMAPPVKFKRHLLTRNFSRLWTCIQAVLGVGEFISSCFTWQNPARSAAAFLVYILFVWNVELYMLPILLLMLLARNYYHIVYKKRSVNREEYAQKEKFNDDEDDEENEENNSKPTLIQRLKAIEEVLGKVQNAIDWIASLLERIHNTFTWSVPFLSALAVIVLTVLTIILYFVSLRTIALLWGFNKFTKRLRKPNYIPNNELLDFLSRIPSEVELDELQELQIFNSSPKSCKKKR